MTTHYLTTLLLVLFLFTNNLFSQDLSTTQHTPIDTTRKFIFMNTTLDEVMNIKVTVASKNAMTLRESPGIITIITEEEIKNMGARDLIDVLRFVPGFDFASDIQNYVGIGVRGNWAAEGKVSVLVDGIELNELRYSNMPFGNHIPVDNIRIIEIIRGPGSAMYGGTSELSVIKITTKQAEQEGIQVSGMYGQMVGGFGRAYGNFTMGKSFKNIKLHIGGFWGNANRGDGIQYDPLYELTPTNPDLSFKMIGNSLLKNRVLNGGLEWKSLKFNFLVDEYTQQTQEGYGYQKYVGQTSYEKYGFYGYSIDNIFNTYAANIQYEFKLSTKLRITPYYQYRYSRPWVTTDTIIAHDYGEANVNRNLFKLEASYDPFPTLNIVLGSQYFRDEGNYPEYAPDPSKFINTFNANNKRQIVYHNISGYTQGILKTKPVTITLGARYDQHSAGFNAFVPRFALTKVFNKFNIKFLAAKAFRTPYIAQINLNYNSDIPTIIPEISTVLEAEAGYQINTKLLIGLNLFYISIKDAIVFNGRDISYINSTALTGSQGIEASLKYKNKWGYIDVNYSYYMPTANSEAKEFLANKDWFEQPHSKSPQANMAFAPHKVNIVVNLKLTKNLNWNINTNIMSKRYGYSFISTKDSTGYIQTFAPQLLLNTFVKYENLLFNGLGLGIGINNILNTKTLFIIPYNTFSGGSNPVNNIPYTLNPTPLPGPSREIYLRLMYTIK